MEEDRNVPNVEIYTKMMCSFCFRAKRLLDSKGIDYIEHAVDSGGLGKQEMAHRAGGRTSVPQIFIAGRHIGGCDDLMDLERAGKLDALLAA